MLEKQGPWVLPQVSIYPRSSPGEQAPRSSSGVCEPHPAPGCVSDRANTPDTAKKTPQGCLFCFGGACLTKFEP